MKNITQDQFRDLLDELELLHKKVDKRALVVPFPPDEDFDQPINIIYVVDRKKLQAGSVVSGYGSNLGRLEALEFCNSWNREKINPKAYVDKDGDFTVEITLFTDEDVSVGYVKQNFILLSISSIALFFKELKQYVDKKGVGDEL